MFLKLEKKKNQKQTKSETEKIKNGESAKRKKKSVLERKKAIPSALFLAPSFIGVMIFFVVPFIVVIYYSVIDTPILKNFVWFDNFIALFQNKAFQQASWNTLKFTLISVPLAVVLSLLMASLLEKAMPFKSQFRSFFLTPMMVPVASIVLVFQVLFNQNGVVNEFLRVFGMDKIDWFKSDFAMIIVVILFLWKNLGYNMILFMAALATVPKNVLEAAKMDGASNKQLFFRLKLKYISPTIFFVTIFSIINSFKVFREVYLLTGDYPYESLYMLQHFMNNAFNSLNYQRLSAAAILMSLVMIVIIGILFLAENRFGKDVEG